MRPCVCHERCEAFTLVEVLVALTLTAMIVSAVGQLSVQALATQRRASQETHRQERGAFLLAALERDLQTLIAEGRHPSLILSAGIPQTLELCVETAVAESQEQVHVPILPAVVRYRLIAPRENEAGYRAVRELRDLTNPPSNPASQTLADGLSGWTLEICSQGKWSPRFPEAKGQGRPQLLRATLLWPDGHQQQQTFTVRIEGS